MYYKIIDGELYEIPKSMTIDGCVVIGYTEEFANAQGYYAVTWSDPPAEEGYTPTYTLTDNKIMQGWKNAE